MTTPSPLLYGIPNCDSVKRARAWLNDGVVHVFLDFKNAGVRAARLAAWMASAGGRLTPARQGKP